MMKPAATVLFCLLTTILCAGKCTPINPIIGDQSYIMKYGVMPSEATDDHERIAAHLEYAEFVLRSKDVTGLAASQIEKRTHLLDLLHEYWIRGIFPRNEDHINTRKPCFIDHQGTICAVGYLVEQTAGRDVAELISERFLYGQIMEMNDPIVINWIENCGLTREECAIIQPSYNYASPPSYNRLSYGVSYRVNDYFYHTFRFEHQRKQGKRKYYNSNGAAFGVQFDWLNNKAFSAGILYSAQMRSQRLRKLVRSAEIMPEYFQYGSKSGMNLRPGINVVRSWTRLFVGAGYSYAIPIINESAYGAGRHDFTLRVGYNLTGLHLPKFPKKPKPTVQPGETPAGWRE